MADEPIEMKGLRRSVVLGVLPPVLLLLVRTASAQEQEAGRRPGVFDPDALVKRRQMALFLSRTLAAAGIAGQADPDALPYSDLEGWSDEGFECGWRAWWRWGSIG